MVLYRTFLSTACMMSGEILLSKERSILLESESGDCRGFLFLFFCRASVYTVFIYINFVYIYCRFASVLFFIFQSQKQTLQIMYWCNICACEVRDVIHDFLCIPGMYTFVVLSWLFLVLFRSRRSHAHVGPKRWLVWFLFVVLSASRVIGLWWCSSTQHVLPTERRQSWYPPPNNQTNKHTHVYMYIYMPWTQSINRVGIRRNCSFLLLQSMGPNVATPELFAEALFTDTSTWTVIDRGPFEALLPITVSLIIPRSKCCTAVVGGCLCVIITAVRFTTVGAARMNVITTTRASFFFAKWVCTGACSSSIAVLSGDRKW